MHFVWDANLENKTCCRKKNQQLFVYILCSPQKKQTFVYLVQRLIFNQVPDPGQFQSVLFVKTQEYKDTHLTYSVCYPSYFILLNIYLFDIVVASV